MNNHETSRIKYIRKFFKMWEECQKNKPIKIRNWAVSNLKNIFFLLKEYHYKNEVASHRMEENICNTSI